jgi:hypothetical protein
MNTNAVLMVRALKRLKAAVGYYELGMTRHATSELDCLRGMVDTGPFRAAEQMLRAEVLKAEEQFEAAAEALESAARMVPAPFNHALWLALSECYRQVGNLDAVANSLACARGAKLPPQPGVTAG